MQDRDFLHRQGPCSSACRRMDMRGPSSLWIVQTGSCDCLQDRGFFTDGDTVAMHLIQISEDRADCG